MELQYRNSARIDLQSFVDHYEEAFRELYRDSGLWNEASIIEGYRKSALMLYETVADAVDAHLAPTKVFGRKRLAHHWYEVDFYAGSRLVIVHYSEDKKQNIRWIESISINRKPIIF